MNKTDSSSTHFPVMLNEVMSLFSFMENSSYLDCTFGGGSYTKYMLEKSQNLNCKIYAFDQDYSTTHHTVSRLKEKYKDKFEFINQNFANISESAKIYKMQNIQAIIFDLGLSTMQLHDKERGFSFMTEGMLDMRINLENRVTAHNILNTKTEKELADIFYYYGEEPKSKQIASTIVKNRHLGKSLKNTTDLTQIIKKHTLPKHHIKSMARIFQAIRIAVNDEMNTLQSVIKDAAEALAINGIIVIVSFHGLECRVIKKQFRELEQNRTEDFHYKILTKKALIPTEKECKINPNSRSAKLRAIKKIKNV